MNEHRIDLYEHFALEKPEGAVGTLCCLDLPTSREISSGRRRPAVLVIPGGGYCFVSEREAAPVALQFLARGYVPFILTYSITPLHFPVQLREAAMAMRYIRENADALEVDPGMVAAIGFSAGGHLCGTLGTMYDCPEVADIGPAELIRPDALALCYAVTLGWGRTHDETMDNVSGGDGALRLRLSLDRQVRPDMPPVYLWHTRDDDLVPCRCAIVLAEKLDEAGVDFSLHLYRHGWHGLSLANTLVYNAGVTPGCSKNVPSWLDECARFWQETGFHITDRA